MAVTYNSTTCLDPSLSGAVTGEYNVTQTLSGMTGSIQAILGHLTALNAKVCSTAEESIQRDNLAAGLISELGTRLAVVEQTATDLAGAIGLTPEQIATLQEAAGFLVDDDGNANTLGQLVTNVGALQTAMNGFQAALGGKADKTVTDDHAARIQALESAGIDLTGYATLDDLCGLSTKVSNALDAVFSKTKVAMQALADAVTTAGNSMQDAVNAFNLVDCVLPDAVVPTIPAASAPTEPPLVG